ncbi:MAG: hypothetical protein AAFX87_12990 [Bacteroidota bacterium]
MKKVIQFSIVAFALLCSTLTIAQETVKLHSFVVLETMTTYEGSPCYKHKVAYISPIVPYQFDSHDGRESSIHPLDKTNKESKLERKWETKVLANYNVSPSVKDCLVSNGWVWNAYSKVDEQRDKRIRELKDRGYTVYINHTFGLSLPKE